jgi:sporulation protein YlmC with PRC-barrel domain
VSTIRKLRGDEVAARDGVIGSLDDVVFDEQWAVRGLAVDTGARGARLMLRPQSVEPGLSGPRKLRLALTRGELDGARLEASARPHLRSALEVIGYGIEARDGAIGQVRDFVVDDDSWTIRDVVVDTRKWWPGGRVRVHPQYVERIDPAERKVHLRLTREQVKLSGARTARR